jgi:hypothetical protein
MFTVTGKGGKIRDVVIGSFARHELWVYLRDYRGKITNHDALFVAQGGSPLTYSGLAQIFKRIRRNSGIDVRVHAHKCRHSFATLAHANGMRGATLQAVLGHSGFDVTRRFYLDIPKEALAQEHEKYGPLDNLRGDIKPTPTKACKAEKVLNENGRWVPSLPDAKTLLKEVQASNYRRVARKYGVSDTTVRNKLTQAGLL